MKASFVNGQSFEWRPAAYRMRNGQLTENRRSVEQWNKALLGHINSAHKGVVSKTCAGCRELKKKIKLGATQ